MLPFHCMKFRDILPEKATLIAVPLSNFNSFFNNFEKKKKQPPKDTYKRSECRQFKQFNTYRCVYMYIKTC